MIREIQASDGNFSGKVAKVNAELINKKMQKRLWKRLQTARSSLRKPESFPTRDVEKLADALNQEHTGIIVFVLDEKRAIDRLYKKNGRLMESFTARFDIAALDSATLVKIRLSVRIYTGVFDRRARQARPAYQNRGYADQFACRYGGEVRDIVDEAIAHANRKTIGHFIDIVLRRRYDEDDMIILGRKTLSERFKYIQTGGYYGKGKDSESSKSGKVPETVYISEADQYLFAQGTHYDIYKKLGAHQSVEDGKKGMSFCRLGTATHQRFCDWNV